MQFDIVIKNLGKINEAKVKIRPFTVIAGKNSSGKSFITKSLYSFFSTVNIDHVTVKAYDRIENIKRLFQYVTQNISRQSLNEKALFEIFLMNIDNIQHEVEIAFGSNTVSNQILKTHLLKEPIRELEETYQLIIEELSGKQKSWYVKKELEVINRLISELNQIVTAPINCLVDGINFGFINALKENFQVSKLSDLKNYKITNEKSITFNFDTLGNVIITGENLNTRLDKDSIDAIQKLHNVVYLESPVYWKLKDALVNTSLSKRFFRLGSHDKKDILGGVPKYFYDLLNLIGSQTKDIPINELYNKINTEIGGEITISNSGELMFKEEGQTTSVSLHNTALGITNLGIISLLLKKGVLSSGSFLFIDEPEVHLHPLWQKTMIDALYDLSISGVNVVIASHSIDMMKCVENIMEKVPENEINEHFGINQLNINGNSIDNGPYPLRQIAAIQEDLGQPFYDLFMEDH
ncbi:MAG: AAA family ATPase [Methylomicrobium sp.]